MRKFLLLSLLLSAVILFQGCVSDSAGALDSRFKSALPAGFTYADTVVPGLILEMRYASKNNFIGDPIVGYESYSRCILTREAAEALRKVQEELGKFSMSLKIYDAYRPQRAVDHFTKWSKDLSDERKKKEYYPDLAKDQIFRKGYIWIKSGHSRGSTVDLTIVEMPSKKELDMGGKFDFFGEISNTAYPNISPAQKANRLLLKSVMEKYGFVNYEKEWWHFTLKNEPYPDTYFDFPVK